MSTNRRFVLGACLIVAAVSYLVYTAIRETSVYYFTIDEFLAKRDTVAHEGVRVAGRVGADSVEWNPATLDLRFRLASFERDTSGGETLLVAYQGILPDMFAEGRDVIVEGVYSPPATLHAEKLLTSCPSKYEAEPPPG
jgi:cytochrome c-type biogenesis protein CcmE